MSSFKGRRAAGKNGPGIADYVTAANFKVTVDNISVGSFQEISGLSYKLEIIEYQDGSDLLVRKRPGRTSFGDITLKKGYVDNVELRKWWENVMGGQEDRRSMVIELMDNVGDTVCSWECFECFPSQWKVSTLEGKSNNALIEEITITTEEVKYKAGAG